MNSVKKLRIVAEILKFKNQKFSRLALVCRFKISEIVQRQEAYMEACYGLRGTAP